MSSWWTPEQGGIYGGVAGSMVGILGGIIGVAAGFLAPRGQARFAVYAMFGLLATVGVVCDVVSLVAWTTGQPWWVWWPLLLMGAVVSLVAVCTFPAVRARYREAELRRLEAEDLRRA